MTLHPSITWDRVEEMLHSDLDAGICVSCGTDAAPVEPDARRYLCDTCGSKSVYGAEELLFLIAGREGITKGE